MFFNKIFNTISLRLFSRFLPHLNDGLGDRKGNSGARRYFTIKLLSTPVLIFPLTSSSFHQLYILEEIVDRPPEYQMFASLYRQVEPVCLLLDGKNQGAFVQVVKRTVFDADANDEGRCKLVFLSSKEYSK